MRRVFRTWFWLHLVYLVRSLNIQESFVFFSTTVTATHQILNENLNVIVFEVFDNDMLA